jgi:hypothetical protein
MQDLKQRNLEKIQFLKDNGCNVVEIWTCDIERQLATEPKMKDFFDNFEISGTSSGILWWPYKFSTALLRHPARREDPLRGFLQHLPMVCILLKSFNSNVLVVNLVKQFLGVTNTASIQLAIPRLLLRTFNLSVSTLAW